MFWNLHVIYKVESALRKKLFLILLPQKLFWYFDWGMSIVLFPFAFVIFHSGDFFFFFNENSTFHFTHTVFWIQETVDYVMPPGCKISDIRLISVSPHFTVSDKKHIYKFHLIQ